MEIFSYGKLINICTRLQIRKISKFCKYSDFLIAVLAETIYILRSKFLAPT